MQGAISFDQLRRILQLTSELREFSPGREARHQHFISELAKLIDAQITVLVDMDWSAEGDPIFVRGLADEGWATDRDRQLFLSYSAEPKKIADPSLKIMAPFLRPGQAVTSFRQQLVSDKIWYRCPHVEEYRRPANVDHFIYSGYMRPGGLVQTISLHRAWGTRPFTENERTLVNMLHFFCAPLLDESERLAFSSLSPRQRQVLGCLARGLQEKEVAEELGLSIHTVHDNVKMLYRRFKVHSRSELLTLLSRGSRHIVLDL